jgi:hypothetical protein
MEGVTTTEEPLPEPTTLLEAIRYYSDLDMATKAFAALRWPDGPICPWCLSKENFYTPSLNFHGKAGANVRLPRIPNRGRFHH